jgi:hypothetical protein
MIDREFLQLSEGQNAIMNLRSTKDFYRRQKKKDREQYPGLKNKEANKSIMIFEPKRGFV